MPVDHLFFSLFDHVDLRRGAKPGLEATFWKREQVQQSLLDEGYALRKLESIRVCPRDDAPQTSLPMARLGATNSARSAPETELKLQMGCRS